MRENHLIHRKLLAPEFKSEKHNATEHSVVIEALNRKEISILGHIIDPQPLMSAIITNLLRKSIDIAISRFENSEITHFRVRIDFISHKRNLRV